MYVKEADGCARTWENVKPAEQVNALSTFDIVESRLCSSDEMFLLARAQWERIHDSPCPPEKTQAVFTFLNTVKFEKLNVSRDMLLYQQKAPPDSAKRLSTDRAKQKEQKRRKSTACPDKPSAAPVDTVQVKVEQYDRHYDCMICSKSVRDDAEAVQCSQCNANPMHKACVENTIYATTCPQCARSLMVI